MCFHNSINTDTKNLEQKYKKKLKDEKKAILPIFHASGFEYPSWPVITSEHIETMNWGLIPSWTRSPQEATEIKSKTLNARIDTILEKPSFRNAKPCIIPSTGFFEWQTVGKDKIPYFINLSDNGIFSMAGLYDQWVDAKGVLTYSFSIVTTEANSLMAEIHNTKKRMPVILKPETETQWLNFKTNWKDFAEPFDANLMKAHVVGNVILSKNHNTPQVWEPQIKTVSEQLNLF